MEFSEACSEVNYILENLNPTDKKKIPESVFAFFKNNKAVFYHVNLNPKQPLVEQELKEETKAFLQILNYKYFADEKQKEQFKQVFDDYENVDVLVIKNPNEREENSKTMQLVPANKENKILKIVKKILNIFRRRNK